MSDPHSVQHPKGTRTAAHVVTTPAERKRAFVILFISLVCMGAGQSVIYTILPPLGRELGLTPTLITSIFAVSALIWIFSSAFWGVRSDRWGRKPVMLQGLAAFALSFACFATVMHAGLNKWMPAFLIFPALVFSRAIYGTFGSGTNASAQAYVADRTAPHERLRGISIISMAFAFGTTFGPVIGSSLTLFGLYVPFYFIAAWAILSGLAIWYFLPERTPPKSHAVRKTTLRWYEPRMFPFMAFGLVLSLIGAIPIQTSGFFFQDVLHLNAHMTAVYTSIGLMASDMAALFAQFVVVQRMGFSSRTLTIAGICTTVLSNTVFIFVQDFPTLILAMIMSGLGFGMARPGFTSGASLAVSPHEQGAVAGLLNAAGAAGFIFGPMIGWLYEFSPRVPYIFGVCAMLALLAAQFLSRVLRNAGQIPPDMEAIEEPTETPVPNN
ncbi:MAG TPA: MFS transporter [Rhizomicrobium sp.]|nr:MFS transporter [Rhizomicrobium sp.]